MLLNKGKCKKKCKIQEKKKNAIDQEKKKNKKPRSRQRGRPRKIFFFKFPFWLIFGGQVEVAFRDASLLKEKKYTYNT